MFDDLDPIEKIRIRELGGESENGDTSASSAKESWTPQVDATEPLRNVVEHFAACIASGRDPLSDGRAGLRTVRLLEAASLSLRAGGRPVELREGALVG